MFNIIGLFILSVGMFMLGILALIGSIEELKWKGRDRKYVCLTLPLGIFSVCASVLTIILIIKDYL